MSINRFAGRYPVDKGTLSRYLNGKLVPRDQWFLNTLLAVLAEQGRAVAQPVRDHLIELQLEALQVAHPHEYKVRRVSDELELAHVGWQEAQRYARSLEEQLADRIRQIEELADKNGQLRAAWDADRVTVEAEKHRLGGRRHLVPEPDQLPVDAPVAHPPVLARQLQHQLADSRWTGGRPAPYPDRSTSWRPVPGPTAATSQASP